MSNDNMQFCRLNEIHKDILKQYSDLNFSALDYNLDCIDLLWLKDYRELKIHFCTSDENAIVGLESVKVSYSDHGWSENGYTISRSIFLEDEELERVIHALSRANTFIKDNCLEYRYKRK